MKFFKKVQIFSDGSLNFFNKVKAKKKKKLSFFMNKIDYKNSFLYTKRISKVKESKQSASYKKKFLKK